MSMNFELHETNLFENAVFAGDAGLVGTDGSGNDMEFPQQLGSLAVIDVDVLSEGEL